MTDQFSKSRRKTSPGTTSVTSLPESADGRLPSGSLGYQQDLFGVPASLASHLTSLLASRLRARLEGSGSPLYNSTWKTWDLPSGLQISALRASAPRTSGKGSTGVPSGWATPVANDDNKSPEAHLRMKKRMGERDGSGANRTAITSLAVQAKVAGWPTPDASAGSGGRVSSNPLARVRLSGTKKALTINEAAQLAGYPTPAARDWRDGRSNQHGKNARPLNEVAMLVGQTASSSPAPTAKRGQLNPALSRWLMGFPPIWDEAAIRAFRSMKRRKRG